MLSTLAETDPPCTPRSRAVLFEGKLRSSVYEACEPPIFSELVFVRLLDFPDVHFGSGSQNVGIPCHNHSDEELEETHVFISWLPLSCKRVDELLGTGDVLGCHRVNSFDSLALRERCLQSWQGLPVLLYLSCF